MWKLISIFFLLNCPVVLAEYLFSDPEQNYRLEFKQDIENELQEAVALLSPQGIRVKVANRLIVVSTKELSLSDLSVAQQEVITELMLLVQYRKQYIYLLHTRTLADALNAGVRLQNLSGVLYTQPDLLPLREERENTPSLLNTLYLNEHTFSVADYLALEKLWPLTRGKGSRVAVIDTGISLDVPDLYSANLIYAWDIDLNLPRATPGKNQRHGNKVAGIIWAQPEKVHNVKRFESGYAWGIAPEAGLIALRLQRPWTSNLLTGLYKAEQQGADVINISWLLPWVVTPVSHYLNYLTHEAKDGKGIVIVVSADPQFKSNTGLAAMPELLVVSSTDHVGTLADASWGNTVDIAAASYLLTVSQLPDQNYEMFAKTSSSAALVSGFVTLLRSWRPELTATEIQLLLVEAGTEKIQKLPQGQSFSYKALNAPKVVAELGKD